jgi:hypothetical protein
MKILCVLTAVVGIAALVLGFIDTTHDPKIPGAILVGASLVAWTIHEKSVV